MTTPADPAAERVRSAAFRRLLHTSAPASAAQLAADLDQPEPDVRAAIDDLTRQGRLRLDQHGHVTGSAGLSIYPDRHQIDLDGRRFWTWCAYDILGIFAALDASGHARSTIAGTGQLANIQFRDGQPQSTPLVLFVPDDAYTACCTDTYADWCPNSNLFPTGDAARVWAREHGVTGEVLTVQEASERGGARWRRHLTNQTT